LKVWFYPTNEDLLQPGADPGGGDWDKRNAKTYESSFIRDDFLQFGKQHSRHKAISPSIILSQ